jgi:hypothetical protein
MANPTSVTKFPRQQAPQPKSDAERGRAYRQRKRHAAEAPSAPNDAAAPVPVQAAPVAPIIAAPARYQIAPVFLRGAAIGLAAVGIVVNGWFARSSIEIPRHIWRRVEHALAYAA